MSWGVALIKIFNQELAPRLTKNIMTIIQRLEDLAGIKFNVSLKKYNTFRIGGIAKYFFEAKTKKDLISAVKLAKELKVPFYVIGGGSKLLISDDGFDGLIIRMKNREFKVDGDEIEMGAGLLMNQLIRIALEESLTGAEWLAGIPGTIGGAINGNAGAFVGSMQDIVISVNAFDTEKEQEIVLNKEECLFGYRDSIFKKNPNLIILSCKVSLKKGNKEEIKKEMKKYFAHRRKIHPLQYPSAGCIFKNPRLKEGQEVPAWKAIVDCGLIGKKVGDVEISEKHSNFIINLGDGKAKEVKELIKIIKDTIKEKTGMEIEEEIQYLQ